MGAEFSSAVADAQEVPPFRREGPRYDMSTFVGRTLHFYSVNDPRTLLFTDEDAKSAERLLKLADIGEAPEGTTDADLWHARRVLESALHPDTGEPIFPLFRFSAFVPVNMVIVTATVTPAVISSFPATAFIHFFNQTYNAAINYANRNASNPVPRARLLEGYGGAVVTSLSIGMLSTALTKRVAARAGGAGGPAAAIIRSTLPFLAVAGAGASNVLLMRRNELTTGVDVFDDEGKDLGKSVEAGKMGLMKCAAARVIWNVPVMMFPPIIMSRLERLRLVSSSPRLRMACETAVVTTCLLAAVSPALAFFPQRDSLAVDTLEPKFSGLSDSAGKPVTRVWYNKGL
ncbi:unnamed protein product [Ectocarpus fasciculatus]